MLLQKVYSVLRLLDEIILVNLLDFDKYFSFHKALGFPLKKIAFLLTQGYKVNLDNPKTFNEKVVYRHLFERNPLLPRIVDKYAVREYVKEKIGEKYLVPLLQVADSFDDIDFSQLPDDYIMKVTHGSGRNVIFKDRKNIRDYDEEALKRTIENWLTEKYRFQQLIWFVQPIKRKIMIEKLLKDDDGEIPKDYKFFVFDGKVEFILVIHDRFSEHVENLYDRDWQVAGFTFAKAIGLVEEKPDLLEDMILLAEKLASNFTFMRVDFYYFASKIYFGELTPCPGGGMVRFVPDLNDEYYGIKWKNHTSLMRKS